MSSPVLSAMGRQLANTIPDSQEDTMTVISEAQSYSSTEIRLRHVFTTPGQPRALMGGRLSFKRN
ncbi:hypothetical protein LB505_013758 [Fusarium chuoi]|nr:hypothetical protein LB505_013758 [Fusarium chuoi]